MLTEKPTKAQFEAARKHLMEHFHDFVFSMFPGHVAALRDVLDYLAPPSADERPDDMAELARLVAKELRRRGIWAVPLFGDDPHIVYVPRPQRSQFVQHDFRFPELFWFGHSLYASQCNGLTPSEIADVIQAEEAKKAAEWAGDT